MPLAITPYLPRIYHSVRTYPVTALRAPTGSGKTVGVPQYIIQQEYLRAPAQKPVIMCTTPVRTAAWSLTDFQRTLVPYLVGSAADRQISYRARRYAGDQHPDITEIIYATEGHVLNLVLETCFKPDGSVHDFFLCDYLMLDEAHSESLSITLLIKLMMLLDTLGKRRPTLIISSASPISISFTPPANEIEIDVYSYGLTFEYVDPMSYGVPGSPHQYLHAVVATAIRLHEQHRLEDGHILIFVPGKSEINLVLELLEDRFKYSEDVELLHAHGNLPPNELRLVYDEYPGKRKIIVGTNVLEMSITIVGAGFVISSMKEKISAITPSGGQALVTKDISKDSAQQQAGRTGRTMPGRVVRVCTEEDYQALVQHREPEINRVPLGMTLLKLLCYMVQIKTLLQGLVDERRIVIAIRELVELKALVELGPDRYQVTRIGHFMNAFTLSVRNAALLWSWLQGPTEWLKYEDGLYTVPNQPDIEIASLRDELKDVVCPVPTTVLDLYSQDGLLMHHLSQLYPAARITCVEPRLRYQQVITANVQQHNNAKSYSCDVSTAIDQVQQADLVCINWSIPTSKQHEVVLYELLQKVLCTGFTAHVVVLINRSYLDLYTATCGDKFTLRTDPSMHYETYMITHWTYTSHVNLQRRNPHPALGVETTMQLDPFTGVVTTCLIDSFGPPYTYVPRKERGESRRDYENRLQAFMNSKIKHIIGDSDLDTCYNIWATFEDSFGLGKYNKRELNERIFYQWCADNGYVSRKIQDLLAAVRNTVHGVQTTLQLTCVPQRLLAPQHLTPAVTNIAHMVYKQFIAVRNRTQTSVCYNLVSDSLYTVRGAENYVIGRDGLNNIKSDPAQRIIVLSSMKNGTVPYTFVGFALRDDCRDFDSLPTVRVNTSAPRATYTRQQVTYEVDNVLNVPDLPAGNGMGRDYARYIAVKELLSTLTVEESTALKAWHTLLAQHGGEGDTFYAPANLRAHPLPSILCVHAASIEQMISKIDTIPGPVTMDMCAFTVCPQQLRWLSGKFTATEITRMCLRAALVTPDNKLPLSIAQYLQTRHGVSAEAMTSPLSTQFGRLGLHYGEWALTYTTTVFPCTPLINTALARILTACQTQSRVTVWMWTTSPLELGALIPYVKLDLVVPDGVFMGVDGVPVASKLYVHVFSNIRELVIDRLTILTDLTTKYMQLSAHDGVDREAIARRVLTFAAAPVAASSDVFTADNYVPQMERMGGNYGISGSRGRGGRGRGYMGH